MGHRRLCLAVLFRCNSGSALSLGRVFCCDLVAHQLGYRLAKKLTNIGRVGQQTNQREAAQDLHDRSNARPDTRHRCTRRCSGGARCAQSSIGRCNSCRSRVRRCADGEKRLRKAQRREGGSSLPHINQQPGNGVQVARQVADGLRRGAVGAGRLVGLAHVDGPCVAQALHGPADGRGQLFELALDLLRLATQGTAHHLGRQLPLIGHLAQLADGDPQPIGQGARQAWRLLHHAVELFTPQHTRLQALNQLGDGCLRGLCPGAAELNGLVDDLGQAGRFLLRRPGAQARIPARPRQGGIQAGRGLQLGVGGLCDALHIGHALFEALIAIGGELHASGHVGIAVGHLSQVLGQRTNQRAPQGCACEVAQRGQLVGQAAQLPAHAARGLCLLLPAGGCCAAGGGVRGRHAGQLCPRAGNGRFHVALALRQVGRADAVAVERVARLVKGGGLALQLGLGGANSVAQLFQLARLRTGRGVAGGHLPRQLLRGLLRLVQAGSGFAGFPFELDEAVNGALLGAQLAQRLRGGLRLRLQVAFERVGQAFKLARKGGNVLFSRDCRLKVITNLLVGGGHG